MLKAFVCGQVFLWPAGMAVAAGVEIQNLSVVSASAATRAANDSVVMRGVEASDTEKASPSKTEGKPELSLEPEGFVLNADIKFFVNTRLEDLLEQGMPLHFLTEIEAYKPRWYWKDELVHKSSQTVRLSYQAITRQFRVTRNGFAVNYRTLGEALRNISSQRGWRFADSRILLPKNHYDIYVRFRLDKAQLPRPFQLTMITDSDWVPVSEWKHFSFTPELTKTAQ